MYPHLVVNIGSGVSILLVAGPSEFRRVGGTACGGGTFLGLSKVLTPSATGFHEALELAEKGDALGIPTAAVPVSPGEALKPPRCNHHALFARQIRRSNHHSNHHHNFKPVHKNGS